MTVFRFANFAESLLERALTLSGTVMFIPPSAAAKFPLLAPTEKFAAVLQDGVQPPEIVYVTTNPLDGSFDIERGREDTAAAHWPAGSSVLQTVTRDTQGMGPGAGGFEWETEFQEQLDNSLAEVQTQIDTLVAVDVATAEHFLLVEASIDDNAASILAISSAFADEQTAMAEYKTELTADLGELTARVATTETAIVTLTESVATLEIELEADFDEVNAAILEEAEVRATADTALAVRTTTLESTVDDPITGLVQTRADLTEEATTRADADTALASRSTALETSVNNPTTGLAATHARLLTEETTRATADTALGTRSTNLEATVNNPTTGVAAQAARLTTVETAEASQNSAIASLTTSVEAVSRTAVNLNSRLKTYTTSPGYPDNWVLWSGAGTEFTRVAGLAGNFGARATLAALDNKGFRQQMYLPAGTYNAVFEANLVSGDWSGASLYLELQGLVIRCSTDPDSNGITSNTLLGYRRWVKQVVIPAAANQSIYAIHGYNGVAPVAAKVLDVYTCEIYPVDGSGAAVTVQARAISALQNNTASYMQKVAAAGAFPAYMQMVSDNTAPGGVDSYIALAAREIVMYSVAGGVPVKGLSVSGTSVYIPGEIYVGPFANIKIDGPNRRIDIINDSAALMCRIGKLS